MAFEAVTDWLPRLPAGTDAPPALPGVGLVAFSDDIELARDRLAVRVVVRDRPGGGLVMDFRDSSPATLPAARFRIGAEAVATASLVALGHALGVEPSGSWRQSVDIVVDPSSWVGTETGGGTPGAGGMAMSRVFDAVLGALAQAWPDKVGAGSCSLGAIVQLSDGSETIVEALPGGEGADAHRDGRDAWSSPILPSRVAPRLPRWLEVEQRPRLDSGGGGARVGGRGIVRSYEVTRRIAAVVAIDRRGNPPHGVARGGPPRGSTLALLEPDGLRTVVEPWVTIELVPGARLVVETCGGAGHGFAGYGDIAFDPADLTP